MFHPNLDAAGTQYFERELTRLAARTFEVKYADLNFRRLFPINRSGDPADESIGIEIYDQVASAKVISAYADDLPAADVTAREEFFPVRSVGTSFHYSILEIMKAQKTGKPLRDRKVKAARRAVEQTLHDIAWNGDAVSGLPGFLTAANVPTANVVAGVSTTTPWTTKTPQEILFDVNDMFNDQDELTKSIEQARVLMLPAAQYNYIATTPMSVDSNMTIMSYLIANSPWLSGSSSIQKVRELAGIGAGSTDVMYIYDPDPEKLEMWILQEVDFLEPQPKSLAFKVPAWARAGGMHVYTPLSISRREGI